MMTIEEMKERIKTLGYTYRQLAQRSRVPLSTIQKVLSGATKSPRHDTLVALEEALGPFYTSRQGLSSVHDQVAAYDSEPVEIPLKKPGEYTIDDYRALPEDYRAELIDGVLYKMEAPSYPHQIIVGHLHAQLLAQAETHDCPCHPFVSPADVQLDCDDKTVVQPDVLVICDLSRLLKGIYYGAPDLVVEVLSPSTRRKDMILKAHKYEHAGVREFWAIDPDERRVMVYDFREEQVKLSIYGFEDSVPVLISDGSCFVDFARILRGLREIFPEGEDGEGSI